MHSIVHVKLHPDDKEVRTVGNAAIPHVTREPRLVMQQNKRLMGRKHGDAEVERAIAADVFAQPVGRSVTGMYAYKIEDGGRVKWYAAEDVAAMILDFLRALAEEKLRHPIDGVVITIPARFGDIER